MPEKPAPARSRAAPDSQSEASWALCLLRHYRKLGGASEIPSGNEERMEEMAATALSSGIRKELGVVGPLL